MKFWALIIVLCLLTRIEAFLLKGRVSKPLQGLLSSFQSVKCISNAQLNMADGDMEVIPPLATEPPLKIALMVEPTPFGYVSGYKNRYEEMLKFLKQAGDDVYILTCDKNTNDPATDFLGYPIETNRGYEIPTYPLVTLTYDLSLRIPKILRDFKPDIIHVSSPSSVAWPTLLWANVFKIPILMSYHTDLVVYSRSYLPSFVSVQAGEAFARFLLRTGHAYADLTLCTSPQLQTEMDKIGIERLDVWKKGINVERFHPKFKNMKMRKHMSDNNPDAPLMVYVGRLGEEKSIHRLQRVLDENPGLRLCLVGTGPDPYVNRLKEQYKDYPVTFTGQLVGDELSQAFASADIFAMPSASETLGFVVLEAMASGVPPIGVAAGGVCDLIEDGSNGYLTSNDDNMEGFSNRVKELIADPNKRENIGLTARAYAEKYSWETATSKLRNIQYRQAILNHRERIQKLKEELEMSKEDEAVLLKQAEAYMPHLA